MKFRKKPIVVDAVQWTGENVDEILNFGNTGPAPLWGADFQVDSKNKEIQIETLEGCMTGDVGDWIIRGINGEFYPCKPHIFNATYEQV